MKRTNHLFVFDTNTLISAFILPNTTSNKAVSKARQSGRVIFSESTANEFVEVFIRPKFDKYLPLEERLEIIGGFISIAQFVTTKITITASRDPKDDQFLELAVAAKATCIISGDQDLLVLHPFQGIPIISASTFLEYQFT